MSANDDLPVVIYTGGHDDCLFLATLLEGGGIVANFIQSRSTAVPDSVVIARRDLALAIPVVEDFKRGQEREQGS
jgi:hypothetical protein